MNFNHVAFIFNRAFYQIFSREKWLFVFCVLALSGLLVLFFRGLSLHASSWVQLSLTFLPIFLCGGILLSMGIVLIRMYHDEIKKREVHYWKTITKSWELVISASYFAIPLILFYLLLWLLLGIFMLLKEIPSIGEFFSVVLSFVPFLIHLSTLLLCAISLLMLFFMAPMIALKGINRHLLSQVIVTRLEKDPFSNALLFLIALFPLLFVLILLIGAAILTGFIYLDRQTPLQTILTWFFVMLPFTAILTPAVIFFFNFAAEAHVLVIKPSAKD
jgi:hypothetical protein